MGVIKKLFKGELKCQVRKVLLPPLFIVFIIYKENGSFESA